jgi:alpha-L-rhamnosidase
MSALDQLQLETYGGGAAMPVCRQWQRPALGVVNGASRLITDQLGHLRHLRLRTTCPTHHRGSYAKRSLAGVAEIRFEHLSPGDILGEPRPRISWIVQSPKPSWLQGAYSIELYDSHGVRLESTGRVESGESMFVEWPFEALQSRQRRDLRVRCWHLEGEETNWSELVPVEAGLLRTADWQARMISPEREEDLSRPQPCPYLRRPFSLRSGIRLARLHITAHGVYEAWINGEPVGDHVMAPGWTSYKNRLRYQSFDVTHLLREGDNALGAILGDGWHRGRLGWSGGRRNIYGDRLGLMAQLEIEYSDDTRQIVATD